MRILILLFLLFIYFFHSSIYIPCNFPHFIVCSIKDAKDDFLKKVEALRNENIYRGVPQAAIGCTWHEGPENIKDVMNEAEALMYCDKQEFYAQYPQYRR